MLFLAAADALSRSGQQIVQTIHRLLRLPLTLDEEVHPQGQHGQGHLRRSLPWTGWSVESLPSHLEVVVVSEGDTAVAEALRPIHGRREQSARSKERADLQLVDMVVRVRVRQLNGVSYLRQQRAVPESHAGSECDRALRGTARAKTALPSAP